MPEGRGLGRDVVAPSDHDGPGVLRRQLRQSGQRRHRPGAQQLQGVTHLELLDVLGQVPRGHALVGVLLSGQGRELLEARLDVVAGDPFAGIDRVQVDLVDDRS